MALMVHPNWRKAIAASADPARAERYLEALLATGRGAGLAAPEMEKARAVAALLGGSEALSELLIAHPDWAQWLLTSPNLEKCRPEPALRREVGSWLGPLLEQRDYAAALRQLRQFKQQEMLRVAVRDLGGLSRSTEITAEISILADICLDAVFQVVWRQCVDRFGHAYSQDEAGQWRPTPLCVLGMGKLGGQELNYSSDVDLLFVYEDEGSVFAEPPRAGATGGRGMPNHQFFQRFVELYVAEITRLTEDGMLYRVDLRLRPEGSAGPMARSLAGYENYYAQWGQTWERMMLIKARRVAGDAGVAAEFLEMIQPFRYPRSIGERILREVSDMKRRIELEVVRVGEIDRNVKLGRGGIREIEFVVQSLQLLHAGRTPFLQVAQTLPALEKFVQYRVYDQASSRALAAAYCFLRDVEHRLQMENNLQTHTLPPEGEARTRLARSMGFRTSADFDEALRRHTQAVRQAYESLLNLETPAAATSLPDDFEGREPEWKALLAAHAFRRVDDAYPLLKTFVDGPGYVLVSPRTRDLARQLVQQFLARCPHQNESGKAARPPRALSDPDRVLARLDTFIATYGARATLYDAWVSNPPMFELLLLVFDRSEFLAETAIRTPDLIEELLVSGQLRRRKGADQMLEDLRHGLKDADQKLWLRKYYQAELMRLGLREILGLVDLDQNLGEITGLAEACLRYALEVVLRRHRIKRAPFAIVGLGKLGGAELTYGSDLDIVFVAGPRVRNLQRLEKVAREIMALLSGSTELGVAFATDARLRPDGEKGLLVNTLPAYEQYYRQRAMLWELQAISRNRPIAGARDVGAGFAKLAATLTNFKRPSLPLAAYRDDWRAEIARMRGRIERERTPAGKEALAIKTGRGGLMDAEFIAQAFCLANGWHEPNTLNALQRARHEGVLAEPEATRLIENYGRLRRVEGILRRWSFASESVLPDEPAPQYRVAVRCGFEDAEAFLEAVAEYRRQIRETYHQVFGTAG